MATTLMLKILVGSSVLRTGERMLNQILLSHFCYLGDYVGFDPFNVSVLTVIYKTAVICFITNLFPLINAFGVIFLRRGVYITDDFLP